MTNKWLLWYLETQFKKRAMTESRFNKTKGSKRQIKKLKLFKKKKKATQKTEKKLLHRMTITRSPD